MGLSVTTAPASEPVTSAEAKQWLHVETSDTSQDSVITILIAAARRKVELYTRRSLVAQTITWEMDADDMRHPITIPRPVINSITSLTTYDSDGNPTIVTSTNYELVEGLFLVSRNSGWDINRKYRAGTLIYSAGPYTDSTDTPEDIKLAMLMMIGSRFENRGDGEDGRRETMRVTADAEDLLADYVYGGP